MLFLRSLCFDKGDLVRDERLQHACIVVNVLSFYESVGMNAPRRSEGQTIKEHCWLGVRISDKGVSMNLIVELQDGKTPKPQITRSNAEKY
jgi:hypothetical protein